MKQFGWLLLIGGSSLAVMNFLMLVMQAELWLAGSRPSWPPMGLSIFWDEKFNTGWVGFDRLLNSHIPTWLMAIATLIGIALAILGMKTTDNQ